MKKILSILLAVCMIFSLTAIFGSATTLNQARTAGYCVWHENNLEVFFANETVATRAKNASFKGIALARNMALDWQTPPSSGEPFQLSGDISVDGVKGTFTLHAGHGCTVADVMEGRKVFIDRPFTQWASERGDEITLRLEGNDGTYYCYYLPIYEEGNVPAFDEFVITNVEFQDENKKNFFVTFSGETDNIWDEKNERGDETKGVTRYCAVRIVKDAVEYELCWDGDTPAQWTCGLNGYCGNWPCKKMWTGDIEFGNLGCNSFDDICNLVKPGGKFEGCIVTYAIEENGTEGNPPVAGDGKIYSLFANGDYMNMALKCSYKTLNPSRRDGAYYVLYDPNTVSFQMAVSSNNTTMVDEGLAENDCVYIIFNEAMKTPDETVKLYLMLEKDDCCYRFESFSVAKVVSPYVWAFRNDNRGYDSWEGVLSYQNATYLPHGNPCYGLAGNVETVDGKKLVMGTATKTNVGENPIIMVAEQNDLIPYESAAAMPTSLDNDKCYDYDLKYKFYVTTDRSTVKEGVQGNDYLYVTFNKNMKAPADDTVVSMMQYTDGGYYSRWETYNQGEQVSPNTWRFLNNNSGYTTDWDGVKAVEGYYTGTHGMKIGYGLFGTVQTATGKYLPMDMLTGTSTNPGDIYRSLGNVYGASGKEARGQLNVYNTPSVTVSYKDTKTDDGKIDALYINAAVADDGLTHGFIFAEDNFATEDNLKLIKDGGNPLFVKYCDKYDVVLESLAYDDAEISAVNLGGEIGDKVIALCWKNMTAFSTFAVREFTIQEDGSVIYGGITTIALTDGSSNLPLLQPIE